jgi:hypothetical protein
VDTRVFAAACGEGIGVLVCVLGWVCVGVCRTARL